MNEGKKEAAKAVNLGILTSVFFILLSQSVGCSIFPSATDWARPAFEIDFFQYTEAPAGKPSGLRGIPAF